VKDWSLPALLYTLESYNGMGYRLYHPHVPSPYLWSFTNHYVSGKYTHDGRWSDIAISQQCGCAAVLRRMAEHDLIEFTDQPPASASLAGSSNTRSSVSDKLVCSNATSSTGRCWL